jgi:hypothetical protein
MCSMSVRIIHGGVDTCQYPRRYGGHGMYVSNCVCLSRCVYVCMHMCMYMCIYLGSHSPMIFCRARQVKGGGGYGKAPPQGQLPSLGPEHCRAGPLSAGDKYRGIGELRLFL